jgi:FkbM family methyltransferase
MPSRLSMLMRQRRPVRFLLSRLLMRAGVSHLFRINRGRYRLIFFPTALSASLWGDPVNRLREEDFLAGWLRPGDTAIDVGANIGSVTLALASAVGPAGQVVAFEAHPRLYQCLVANIALNKAPHVVAHARAAGAAEGLVGFSDGSNDDENSVVSGAASLQVPVSRLDDFAPQGPVRLLKIDVEGYEPVVLAGAGKTLARTDQDTRTHRHCLF